MLRASWPRQVILISAFVVLAVVGGRSIEVSPSKTAGAQRLTSSPKLLVGAYYSMWYPQNLAQGYLREHLIPSQPIASSQINSDSPLVAEQDITNAKRAKINFFALDWWPYYLGYSNERVVGNRHAVAEFLKAPNISQFKFCIFYETWNLGFDAGREATPVTRATTVHFDKDMRYLALHYLHNPSYLKIHNRPVIILYLTRTLTGNVAKFISSARSTLERMGVDPFFIGDEIFWRTTPENPSNNSGLFTQNPQSSRLRLFDAITDYSLYYGGSSTRYGPPNDFLGYPGKTNLVADEVKLYAKYQKATNNAVPIVPDISPGFNDRGVRLVDNHPAQPRQWLSGLSDSSTLDYMFREVGVPSIDNKLPMIMVTTWNEWNEDTGVEPIGGSPTSRDNSPSHDQYTQGYVYGGEGNADLATLSKDIQYLDRIKP